MPVKETTDSFDLNDNLIRREEPDGTISICHYDENGARDGLANNRGYRAGWYETNEPTESDFLHSVLTT